MAVTTVSRAHGQAEGCLPLGSEEQLSILSLAATVGGLKTELGVQLALVRNELKALHTKMHLSTDASGEAITDLILQPPQGRDLQAVTDAEGNKHAEAARGYDKTSFSVPSESGFEWIQSTPRETHIPQRPGETHIPPGYTAVATQADLDDLSHSLVLQMNGCFNQVVTAAKEAAARSTQEHLHILLQGIEPRYPLSQWEDSSTDVPPACSPSVQSGFTRDSITCSQRASTSMLQDAVDRLAGSQGQLLEAVADQVKRVDHLELELNALVADLRKEGVIPVRTQI